jgi:hypothetical protein
MDTPVREIPDLELALLRRGVDERTAEDERCRHCKRTPLIGEHVYADDSGTILCELCRMMEDGTALRPRLVHGPAFGHTIRITDRRAA